MPGRATAVKSGAELEAVVQEVGRGLGLQTRRQVKVGRRLWGAERHIDIVMTLPDSDRSIGLECKYQGGTGTAEEKIPAIIQDIVAWPIPGLVVFAGEGFSSNMKSYLHSTGKGVAFEDLDGWLRLFFGLPDG